ncbi:protein FAR1-RELATED SEQUENCE 5-like [Tripterygium wilfordii]|uniref:protein FAR1-RELATED SEQUENCE 5-like n=1 Tax=Tripterygium wilfordii TaxID=458696 RepID=UPI0018F80D4F|nr:protein FAR1-RELATED SEQUENCE 5-like [Tripterygium wilfordii]
MLGSHRELTTAHALAVELVSDSGLTPKATHKLLSKEDGDRGKLGCVIEDQKSYLRSRRKRDMGHGELGSIFTYFERQNMSDLKFYYALQLDSANQVTNIFWANAKMVDDYVAFGDMLAFGATFGTNEGMMPLGMFIGYNHHRQIVIFRAALLYDKTIESFKWLFNTSMNAHGGKEPCSIFTDQDATMASA